MVDGPAFDVTVTDIAGAAEAWATLSRLRGSPYQDPRWLSAWTATIGKARRITPCIVVARDRAGKAVGLLPFGTATCAGLRVATFLGGRDSNTNLGLFDPGVSWTAEGIRTIFHRAARIADIDLFILRNQPERTGPPNPLALLRKQRSPSSCHCTTLLPSGEAFLHARLSKHARKLLRQKRGRLEAMGNVDIRLATTVDEAAAVIDAYLAHKADRPDLLEAQDEPARDTFRQFILAAGLRPSHGEPAVSIYGLWCGSEIVATFGGTGDMRRFSGMFVSFDPRPDIARCSPGDQLLAAVVSRLCDAGVDSFDLGIGEARYKDALCPDVEMLFDSVIGVTPLGHAAASAVSGAGHAKRWIKQTPWAWSLARRVRSFRRRER